MTTPATEPQWLAFPISRLRHIHEPLPATAGSAAAGEIDRAEAGGHRGAAGVAGLPGQALAQARWYRGSGTEVTVYIERTRVGATNWSTVKRAGVVWAYSGRIQILFVGRCPSRWYCVKVYDGRWATNEAAGPPSTTTPGPTTPGTARCT